MKSAVGSPSLLNLRSTATVYLATAVSFSPVDYLTSGSLVNLPNKTTLFILAPSRTEIRYTCTICDNVHLMAEINQISAITINTSIYTAIASYICSPPCVFETTDFADSCSNSARWYISLIFIITMIIHVLVYRH